MAPREQASTQAGVISQDEQAQVPSIRSTTVKRNKPSWTKLNVFLAFLALDALTSVLLLSPLIPKVTQTEDASSSGHYLLHKTLWDLAIMMTLRLAAALYAILYSFFDLSTTTNGDETEETSPSSSARLFHKNGDRKSKAELEEEELQEPILPKIFQYMKRPAFLCEFTVVGTGVLLAIKCLVRLDIEIASGKDVPEHPAFWAVLVVTGFFSFLETLYIDQIESVAGDCGHAYRDQRRQPDNDDNNDLTEPLLSNHGESRVDEEEGVLSYTQFPNGDVRGHSNIGADANFKAKISDLLEFCAPDKYWMMCAFLFLLGAAATQVYIPKFTGDILDALITHTNNHPDDDGGGHSVMNIPNFVSNIEKLTITALLGGIFGGCRGAIFSIVGARVNVRLRVQLMDALLMQDIGFFDTTRTGDITSRLGSDTTLVSSSMTSSVNVFLRSSVRAVGTLIFMFVISWQLSLLAFITIPVVTILSKWYGIFLRNLARIQQKKLADGNNVSESTFSSMSTVKAFGAEIAEMAEFEKCMEKYISLNKLAAIATLGYGTCVNTLPQIVKALVLYYGGLLVVNGEMSGGQLVTFILYLSALAESFNSLAGIYATLTRAVGGADKVFELMSRQPQFTRPSHVDEERVAASVAKHAKRVVGIECTRVVEQRVKGLHPEVCAGEITLSNVEMRYPARPQRVVLDNLSVTIPPGAIVALVGSSGSGKSSVVSLIQHLYEPTKGDVCIDGVPVYELSPEWISKHVSVVMQEPTLFARSIRRNIIYGLEGTDQEPTQDEVEEAARLANAASFIERLPFGYDTDVGERGIQLSGGQKQRIAIARALVRKPRILLLDEATSALDAESEHIVQEAIDDMIKGQRSLNGDPGESMTVVIIAHRLSTIRNADIICVVENGGIIEQGSHEELMCIPDGAYNSLVRRQLQPFPSDISLGDLSTSYIAETGE